MEVDDMQYVCCMYAVYCMYAVCMLYICSMYAVYMPNMCSEVADIYTVKNWVYNIHRCTPIVLHPLLKGVYDTLYMQYVCCIHA